MVGGCSDVVSKAGKGIGTDFALNYPLKTSTRVPDPVSKGGIEMFDPVIQHLPQAKQTATWVVQLMQLDPELMIPAALPLLAARLMDAGGVEEDPEPESTDPQLGLAVG